MTSLFVSLQDFEAWDDVGLNTAKPPDLLHLYRDYTQHSGPSIDMVDAECMVDLGYPVEVEERIASINNIREQLVSTGIDPGELSKLGLIIFFFKELKKVKNYCFACQSGVGKKL